MALQCIVNAVFPHEG